MADKSWPSKPEISWKEWKIRMGRKKGRLWWQASDSFQLCNHLNKAPPRIGTFSLSPPQSLRFIHLLQQFSPVLNESCGRFLRSASELTWSGCATWPECRERQCPGSWGWELGKDWGPRSALGLGWTNLQCQVSSWLSCQFSLFYFAVLPATVPAEWSSLSLSLSEVVQWVKSGKSVWNGTARPTWNDGNWTIFFASLFSFWYLKEKTLFKDDDDEDDDTPGCNRSETRLVVVFAKLDHSSVGVTSSLFHSSGIKQSLPNPV